MRTAPEGPGRPDGGERLNGARSPAVSGPAGVDMRSSGVVSWVEGAGGPNSSPGEFCTRARGYGGSRAVGRLPVERQGSPRRSARG